MDTFDPKERAKQKQESRDKDQYELDNGLITKEELRKRNSFFGAITNMKLIKRRIKMTHIGGKPLTK